MLHISFFFWSMNEWNSNVGHRSLETKNSMTFWSCFLPKNQAWLTVNNSDWRAVDLKRWVCPLPRLDLRTANQANQEQKKREKCKKKPSFRMLASGKTPKSPRNFTRNSARKKEEEKIQYRFFTAHASLSPAIGELVYARTYICVNVIICARIPEHERISNAVVQIWIKWIIFFRFTWEKGWNLSLADPIFTTVKISHLTTNVSEMEAGE